MFSVSGSLNWVHKIGKYSYGDLTFPVKSILLTPVLNSVENHLF